jgi:hypothetical protein
MLTYRYCKPRKEGGRERYQLNPHESDTVLFLFNKEDKKRLVYMTLKYKYFVIGII